MMNASTSTTTAAQQLLQKLVQQQQSPIEEDKPQPLYYPLILLQYSCHVSHRVAAATRTTASTSSSARARSKAQQQQQRQMAKVQAEADLYRRAQLRTPDENAQRLIWGGALWLEYLTKCLIQEQRKQSPFLWVSTSTRPTPLWLQKEQLSSTLHVINSAELYWDYEEDEDKDSPHPLASLLTLIRQRCCTGNRGPLTATEEDNSNDANPTASIYCTSIVIESLIPWIQLFGFSTVHQFLQALLVLPHTLVLIPSLTETLSTTQHQALEDLSHTCLWLSNHTGQVDMHVLRHGIREYDNRVREIWDFTLLPNNDNLDDSNPFRLSVGTVGTATNEKTEDFDEVPPDQVNLVEAMNPALTTEHTAPRPVPAAVKEANNAGGGDTTAAASLKEVNQRTKKILLAFEEEDAPRKMAAAAVPAAPVVGRAPRNFNVFVQDDDPEYEDYDSDDPDDDLDI